MIIICKRNETDAMSVTYFVSDNLSDDHLSAMGGKVLVQARSSLQRGQMWDEIGPVLFGCVGEPDEQQMMDCHERYRDGALTAEQRQAFYEWQQMPADLIERDEAELAAKGHLWQSEDEKWYFHTHKHALGIVGWAK